MGVKRQTVKLTDTGDLEKVRKYHEARHLLEEEGQALIWATQHRAAELNAKLAAITEEIEAETEKNSDAHKEYNERFESILFKLWTDLVKDHFPATNMRQAFMNGEVHIDLTYYEKHGDVYLCKFEQNDLLPSEAIPAERVLH